MDTNKYTLRNASLLFLLLISLVLILYGFVQQARTGVFDTSLLIVGGIGLVVAGAFILIGRRERKISGSSSKA